METYCISFRCYYHDCAEPTKHFQSLPLSDIGKWIDCYKFTHPMCKAISVKIWFEDRAIED